MKIVFPCSRQYINLVAHAKCMYCQHGSDKPEVFIDKIWEKIKPKQLKQLTRFYSNFVNWKHYKRF